MSLRVRTLAIIGLTLGILLAGLYVIARLVVLQGYARLEARAMRRDVERALNALADDLADLDQTARDYAYWDETYAFLETRDPEYLAANFPAPTFANNALDVVLLVTGAGEVLYVEAYDAEARRLAPVAEDLQDPALLARLGQFPALDSGVAGVVRLPAGRMLLASRPVLTSLLEGPARGSLVMGRWLDAGVLSQLAEVTRLDLALLALDDPSLPEPARASALGGEPVVIPAEGDAATVAGYALVADLDGRPAFALRVTTPREIYQAGEQSLSALFASALAVGLVFAAVTLLLLERSVLARVARLSGDVGAITRSGDVTARVVSTGDDELAHLGRAVNTMLGRLELAQVDIATARDHALESLRFKSRFLANVSHDLRTPLNAIVGYVEMLQEGVFGPVNPDQQDALARVLHSAHHLLGQIGELLDHSRLEAGALTLRPGPLAPADLLASVRGIAEPLAQAKGLRLTQMIMPGLPPWLVGDADRLRLILLNLTGNAVKFTERGEVSVCLDRPDDTHWSLAVSDTGSGIPAEAQALIFEPFRQVEESLTRRHGGVGLGLSIVKQLVDLMGGTVTVQSEVGRGSTFTVRLPLVTLEDGEAHG